MKIINAVMKYLDMLMKQAFRFMRKGSTWFKVTSNATYGYNSAFPAGTYTAIAVAECIPQ